MAKILVIHDTQPVKDRTYSHITKDNPSYWLQTALPVQEPHCIIHTQHRLHTNHEAYVAYYSRIMHHISNVEH